MLSKVFGTSTRQSTVALCRIRHVMKGAAATLVVLSYLWISSLLSPSQGNGSSNQVIRLGVYYETKCPDSIRFINQQLWPAYDGFKRILQLDLVPYGKATETLNEKTGLYEFDCQHGPPECKGNLIQTCAIRLLNDTDKALAFIYCMESYDRPEEKGEFCSNRLKTDYKPIQECTQSKQGNEWQHEMAQKTSSLDPKMHFVPWFTVNGVHTDKIQNEVFNNFKNFICSEYKGPKPEACK